MDALVKAILKDQPNDIIEFCTLYFERKANMENQQQRSHQIDNSLKGKVLNSF